MEFQVSPELLAIYLEDARAHLEALDHGLLALEREGLDLEVVSSILGPLHTLKGNSGMLGFEAIARFTHVLENLLMRLRGGELDATRPVINTLLASADVLRTLVQRRTSRRPRKPSRPSAARRPRPSRSRRRPVRRPASRRSTRSASPPPRTSCGGGSTRCASSILSRSWESSSASSPI